jgi:hypothetical protein
MAKKTDTAWEAKSPTRRRHKKRGLNLRKKLGPKSNMRIR